MKRVVFGVAVIAVFVLVAARPVLAATDLPFGFDLVAINGTLSNASLPEPASMILLGTGLLAALRPRKQQA